MAGTIINQAKGEVGKIANKSRSTKTQRLRGWVKTLLLISIFFAIDLQLVRTEHCFQFQQHKLQKNIPTALNTASAKKIILMESLKIFFVVNHSANHWGRNWVLLTAKKWRALTLFNPLGPTLRSTSTPCKSTVQSWHWNPVKCNVFASL